MAKNYSSNSSTSAKCLRHSLGRQNCTLHLPLSARSCSLSAKLEPQTRVVFTNLSLVFSFSLFQKAGPWGHGKDLTVAVLNAHRWTAVCCFDAFDCPASTNSLLSRFLLVHVGSTPKNTYTDYSTNHAANHRSIVGFLLGFFCGGRCWSCSSR